MASRSHHQSKKRCNNSLSSPLHPIQKKQQCVSSSSSFEESFEERDSGLETFISDECSIVGETVCSPPSRRDSEGFQDLYCAEGDLRDNPVVIRMDRHKHSGSKVSRNSGRGRSSASKENRRDVIRGVVSKKKTNFVTGQSLAKAVNSPLTESPDPTGKFRIRPNVLALRSRPRFQPDTFDARETACPFLDKDKWNGYQRTSHIFGMHPELEPYMRSMLLEWMMEVSKAHTLQRKTYQMALDFVDRFLSYTENVPKNILQLLGVSSLSIAAKIEEIFPPKLSEMAYVTDEAHDASDIKAMERIILNVLGTAFMPVTVCEWAGIFLFGDTRGSEAQNQPQTPKMSLDEPSLEKYARVCRLADLAMLDHNCCNYSYRQIAAAAIYSVNIDEKILQAMEESFAAEIDSIIACIQWMKPYTDIEDCLPPPSAAFASRSFEPDFSWPHLQSHDFDLEIFLRALNTQQQFRSPLSEQNENLEQLSLIDWEDVDEEVVVTSILTPQRAHLSSAFYTPPDSQAKSRRRYE
ncbi:G1/S-specific cyclin-E1-like [Paramacrobiotus metropolitanus]|uniref:G1/S-specific cyclin-E1-like n=1 Tax=Paramacrobiotus metropolitanus TaxID=2943436 RepID=UPI002445E073|nr:G1/S-specific cyclin-E1-like [Paramacrobiotus metropolitanus]XP_055330225.1 G1/S-specific cyclin-E1-like [Paramacrobiotus metropolitanus]